MRYFTSRDHRKSIPTPNCNPFLASSPLLKTSGKLKFNSNLATGCAYTTPNPAAKLGRAPSPNCATVLYTLFCVLFLGPRRRGVTTSCRLPGIWLSYPVPTRFQSGTKQAIRSFGWHHLHFRLERQVAVCTIFLFVLAICWKWSGGPC